MTVNRHSIHGLKHVQDRKQICFDIVSEIYLMQVIFLFPLFKICFSFFVVVVRSIVRTLNFKFIKLFFLFSSFFLLLLHLIFLKQPYQNNEIIKFESLAIVYIFSTLVSFYLIVYILR